MAGQRAQAGQDGGRPPPDGLSGLPAGGPTFVPVETPANPGASDAAAVRHLRNALAARPIDVVHAHGLRAGFVAGLARSGAPLIVTWHNAVLAKGLRGEAWALGTCPWGFPRRSSEP